MITEDYVSFEVAKLLKEKGFDGDTNCYYIEGSIDKNLYYSPIRNNHNKRITNNEFDINIDIDSSRISAPTLQMAMKWLRDVHKKVINVEYIDFLEHGEVWSYFVLDRNTFHEFTEKSESFTEHSYEEACEAAIKYCLENLI